MRSNAKINTSSKIQINCFTVNKNLQSRQSKNYKNSGQYDIENFKSPDQVYKRSWYGLGLFKVNKVFTDRLCHQSTTAPTQPKRSSKALQCPSISLPCGKKLLVISMFLATTAA